MSSQRTNVKPGMSRGSFGNVKSGAGVGVWGGVGRSVNRWVELKYGGDLLRWLYSSKEGVYSGTA